MTGPETVLEQLRRSNPEPSLDALDADELALVFSVLQERRSSMTTTKKPQKAPHQHEPHRWLKPALVFAASLVTALVVIGGGVLLVQGGTQSVVEEPVTTAAPVTTTPPPVTTTVPPVTTTAVPQTIVAAPTPPPLDEGWEVFVVAGDKQPTMAAGFVDGIGWIAVGGRDVMMSPDGSEWIESDTEGVIAGDGAFLSGIVAGGPGAVTYGRTCEFGRCSQEPALYGSSDGLTWERIDSEAFHGCVGNEAMECYAGIDDLAVSSDGSLLAAGPDTTSRSGAEGDPYITESVLWTSDDGYAWQRHEIDLSALAPEGWNVWSESPENLIHIGDRWLAMLRIDRYVAEKDDWDDSAILIESADGAEWAVVDTGEAFAEGSPDQIVSGPDGVLAIGGQTTWSSVDGHEWTQSTIPGDYWYDRVIALESGFLAYTREGPTVFAFSPDGITWVTVDAGEDLADVGWNELSGAEIEGEVTLVGVGYHFSDSAEGEEGGVPSYSVITHWSGDWSD